MPKKAITRRATAFHVISTLSYRPTLKLNDIDKNEGTQEAIPHTNIASRLLA